MRLSRAAASARQHAARLLALAMAARERGNSSLAELLTDAATAAFDLAEQTEAASPPSGSEPHQSAVQQQIQPDKDEPDNKE
jgi:hypothetical protein